MCKSFKLEEREYLKSSNNQEDNRMDIDTAFNDGGSASSSTMESEFQIPKVELQTGDNDVSVLKR